MDAGGGPGDAMLAELAERLGRIEGVVAVALGGSRATGNERPDSDYDLGLYYRDSSPFRIRDVKELAREISDVPDPVVTDFGRWGRWVNGGAWLTIRGQRVDFLYRSLDRIEEVIEECRQGQVESDFYQQPPYGFHSYIYLGELSICRPLVDPHAVLAGLKERLVPYPEPLKAAIVNRSLWGAEFDLAHAKKLAGRGDVYGATGCFGRCASRLVQVLYALNEQYFVTDNGALAEIGGFRLRPEDFAQTMEEVLSRPGGTAVELTGSAARIGALVRDVVRLCGSLYTPPDFRA